MLHESYMKFPFYHSVTDGNGKRVSMQPVLVFMLLARYRIKLNIF